MRLARQQIIEHHEREISDLKDILYAMKLRFNERESEAEQEFQGLMDELKNKVGSSALQCYSSGVLLSEP